MRVRAMQQVYYAGRDRDVGEEFETEEDMHAKVLIISGKVTEVITEAAPSGRRGRYKRRDMRAEK